MNRLELNESTRQQTFIEYLRALQIEEDLEEELGARSALLLFNFSSSRK